MVSLALVPSLLHLFGFSLGVGAATIKLALVVRATREIGFLPVLLKVGRLITRFIIVGLVLVTVSGGYWLTRGYPWSPLLVAKVVIVGVIWVLGPIIDNVVEPKLARLAPVREAEPTPAFHSTQRVYLAAEICATGLMYGAVIIGASL